MTGVWGLVPQAPHGANMGEWKVLYSANRQEFNGLIAVEYDTDTQQGVLVPDRGGKRGVFGPMFGIESFYGMDSGLRLPGDARNITVYFIKAMRREVRPCPKPLNEKLKPGAAQFAGETSGETATLSVSPSPASQALVADEPSATK